MADPPLYTTRACVAMMILAFRQLCWAGDAAARPKFADICDDLRTMHANKLYPITPGETHYSLAGVNNSAPIVIDYETAGASDHPGHSQENVRRMEEDYAGPGDGDGDEGVDHRSHISAGRNEPQYDSPVMDSEL
jgi:hypothetical protein